MARASVLIVGAGGLGSPAALYLAASGVGRLGIVDRDSVELSNLHRQVIHVEASVGLHKAVSAAAACKAINSSIQVLYFCTIAFLSCPLSPLHSAHDTCLRSAHLLHPDMPVIPSTHSNCSDSCA